MKVLANFEAGSGIVVVPVQAVEVEYVKPVSLIKLASVVVPLIQISLARESVEEETLSLNTVQLAALKHPATEPEAAVQVRTELDPPIFTTGLSKASGAVAVSVVVAIPVRSFDPRQ